MTRAAGLRGFTSPVEELGGDPNRLLKRFALSPDLIASDDELIPIDAHDLMFDTAASELHCPDLGLRPAALQHLSVLGPLALAIQESSTVAAALQCAGVVRRRRTQRGGPGEVRDIRRRHRARPGHRTAVDARPHRRQPFARRQHSGRSVGIAGKRYLPGQLATRTLTDSRCAQLPRTIGREIYPNASSLEDSLDQNDSMIKEKTLADPCTADLRWLQILPLSELAPRKRQWPVVPTYVHGGIEYGEIKAGRR
ncbi:AraC family transcriptional regulator ligand-binding domain-containing protein [Rhodococcus artemisiae]|uniref:AraC family transcriptional regulator ligand-binding domain-containing protein n=1 Tax=Rhodococcus artemisiae TaxID=714159 RepID=A0ABU7L547_9NOCA|nr:AraC family transcriptional regulator ligand-binding domain-containing protein [Rhodococcus artemisiae]MEE2056664.1 AraC family transcriptional regulator ligand-binding domain-containing protein [Rhodococcus artemisiae]